MVHKPTFVRQYKHFWEDPESVSLTRLALLFTVCCLSMQDYDRNGNEPTDLQNQTSRLSDNYLDRAAQCILLSEITAPHPDSIQCLILYGMAEAYRVRNGLSIWMFQGILIRKAMHMGYHRDPDTFPSISPFDREMRRRLWHSISQLEQLLSFQLGLPPMIQMSATDVAPPKNLFEEDLWEDMSSCPPSRPLSQATPVSYMICKHLAFRAFGKVVLYLSCTNAQNYSRVLELNQELADSYSAIPTYLKRKPWEESLGDPRWLRLQRMQLEMNYCKAFCVLNRRYIAIPKGSTQPLPSRALCIQSALNLLAIQTNMRQEGSKWHAFSFCCHDFLLATIIASLVLHTSTAETQEALNSENLKLWSALETSRRNWEEVRDISPEARNACRVIDTVYENLRPPPAEPPNESVPVIKNDGPQTSFAPGLELSFVPAWVGDESLGPNSGFDWTSWDSVMQGNDFDTFNNLWQV